MKKLVWLMIALTALVACKKADYTVISGKIENAGGATEAMLRSGNDFSQKITLNEDGTFADTIKNVSGVYNFILGRAAFPIYLEQGDNIVFNADAQNMQAVEIVSGKAKASNEFLKKFQANSSEVMKKLGGGQAIYSMPEADFLRVMDSIKNVQVKEINEAKGLTPAFKNLQTKDAEYGHLYSVMMFPEYHKYLTKKEDFTPSEAMKGIIEGIDFTNEKDYKEVPVYRQIVLSNYMNQYNKDGADKNAVLETIKASPIKALSADVAKNLLGSLGPGTEDLDGFANQIKGLTTDEKVLTELNTKLEAFRKLAAGQPSPTFEYKSIDGKTVKLEDLKGKMVYIDVWATWCGPCKRELPFLQGIEKEYHKKPIHFVSVSVDQDKAAWENMVKGQKLGGIQLHAEKKWASAFVKAYQINGIPRFILLDKEGNIISANAPRPSDPKLKTILDENLAK